MWEAPRPISGSHPAANSLKRACAGTGSACSRSHAKTLEVSHKDYIKLLRKLRDIPGVKKVFIRSGIRFDYVMADRDDTFLKELCQYHVSGQLKVAPEHICDAVLTRMGKPRNRVYQAFADKMRRSTARSAKSSISSPI